MNAFFPGQAAIEAYGNGGFRFAGMSHRGGILCIPSGIHAWNADPLKLTFADFALAVNEASEIDILLFGSGATMRRLSADVAAALQAGGLAVDAMSTGNAVSTYNFLLGEGRRVAAALLPVENAA